MRVLLKYGLLSRVFVYLFLAALKSIGFRIVGLLFMATCSSGQQIIARDAIEAEYLSMPFSIMKHFKCVILAPILYKSTRVNLSPVPQCPSSG